MTVNNQPQSGVAGRLVEVRARIAAAAARSGRSPAGITMIGVTKGIEAQRVEEALGAGLVDLGENRIQEWLPKAAQLGLGPRWHFIGRLQTNKVRYLARGIQTVHSLDRPELLDALSRRWSSWRKELSRLGPADGPWPEPACLVQVNVAGEDAKAGLAPKELEGFLHQIVAGGVVRVRGLMTVAPYTSRPEDVRWVFAALRELRDRTQPLFPELELGELSMGMSGDYEVAVAEGATMVRIGTAIFGARG